MPSFVFLIGDVIDSFSPTTKPEDTVETISRMSLIFTLVGFAVWLFSYFLYSFLLLFSERVVKKIRVKYLSYVFWQNTTLYKSCFFLVFSRFLGVLYCVG